MGHLNVPVIITVIILPIFGFMVAFMGAVPYQAMFAQLSLLLGLCIWILNIPSYRIAYILVYLACLFFLYNSHNSFVETCNNMFIVFAYIWGFYLLTSFIEKQDSKLSTSLNHQRFLNDSLKEKNERLTAFGHIMSHDLKEPLRNITSFIQLIRKRITVQNTVQNQYFDIIESASKEMNIMIDDLLFFQKVESDEIIFENICLKELITDVSSIYQVKLTNNKIQIDICDLPKVRGNVILLKALFSNLISNSRKYQPKDKESHIPFIKVWSEENIESFEILISDNGIGIEKTYIKNLFLAFKRFHNKNEYKGTGLGMSICKSVMDKHSGNIELSDTSIYGSTFKLIFPKNAIS
jgi:signal transduction histidine kinase